MKKLFMGLAVSLCVLTGFYSVQARANGAIIVLLMRMLPDDYTLKAASQDYEFSHSQLFDVLESSQSSVYVLRVHPDVYSAANFYAQNGNDVALTLPDSNSVTFHYYPVLHAMVGKIEGFDCVFVLDRLATEARP